MHILSFVPDKPMIKLQYRIKTARKLNLKSPKRFTEKLQWYKLYWRDPLMAKCVNKKTVREYVKDQGLGNILNEIIGVYDNPNNIDFSSLPKSFVLKDTLGGGGNSVLICKDKDLLDWNGTVSKMISWLQLSKGKNPGREWVYDFSKKTGQIKNQIIIEKYIPSDPSKGGLIDYKFFCFNGKVSYIYVVADRIPGVGGGFGIFTRDYNKLDVCRADERPLERVIPKPENFSELITIAEKLSKPFPHARIDLYDVEGKVIFGEITFFDGSGYMTFNPDSFDEEMGNSWNLPLRKKLDEKRI